MNDERIIGYTFNCGDRVTVLTEQEMMLNEMCYKDIFDTICCSGCTYGFTKSMEKYSEQVFIIGPVSRRDDNNSYYKLIREEDGMQMPFTWQDFMLKPAGETRLLEPASDDEIMSLFE